MSNGRGKCGRGAEGVAGQGGGGFGDLSCFFGGKHGGGLLFSGGPGRWGVVRTGKKRTGTEGRTADLLGELGKSATAGSREKKGGGEGRGKEHYWSWTKKWQRGLSAQLLIRKGFKAFGLPLTWKKSVGGERSGV